jgi:hypothetical protein
MREREIMRLEREREVLHLGTKGTKKVEKSNKKM